MVQTSTIEGCGPLFTWARASTTIEICRVICEKIDPLIRYFSVKWQQRQQKKNLYAASAAERMKIFNSTRRFRWHLGGSVSVWWFSTRQLGRVQNWSNHRTDGSEETLGRGCFTDDDMTSADGFFFLRAELQCLPAMSPFHVPLQEALLISYYYKITWLEKRWSTYFVNLLLNIISQ